MRGSAAAERSGSTEAAEEAVAEVVERLCAAVAAGDMGRDRWGLLQAAKDGCETLAAAVAPD